MGRGRLDHRPGRVLQVRPFGFDFVAVAVPPPLLLRRSAPNLVGRVAGRLPRTLSSSLFSLIAEPVYVSRVRLGAFHSPIGETLRTPRRKETWRTLPMDASVSSA